MNATTLSKYDGVGRNGSLAANASASPERLADAVHTLKRLWMLPFLVGIFLAAGMWLGRSGAGLFISAASKSLGVPL